MILSSSKVALEHVSRIIIGKQDPDHEYPSLPTLDVEVHRDAAVVIEPLAKLPHCIGKRPTSQTHFDFAHCWPAASLASSLGAQ